MAKDRMFAHEAEQRVLLAAIRSFVVSVLPRDWKPHPRVSMR